MNKRQSYTAYDIKTEINYSHKKQWLKGCPADTCSKCKFYINGCTRDGYAGTLFRKNL